MARYWPGIGPVRDWLRKMGHEGVDCPCCGQFVKFYRRKLNATLTRCLIWIVRYYEEHCTEEDPWVPVYDKGPRYVVRQGGYAAGMLANWGFLEPLASDDEKRRNSGKWRPTPLAIAFVHDRVRVPSSLVIYDSKVRERSEDTVSVREALGKKWDYSKLMSGEGA